MSDHLPLLASPGKVKEVKARAKERAKGQVKDNLKEEKDLEEKGNERKAKEKEKVEKEKAKVKDITSTMTGQSVMSTGGRHGPSTFLPTPSTKEILGATTSGRTRSRKRKEESRKRKPATSEPLSSKFFLQPGDRRRRRCAEVRPDDL